jgi:hypothetical protein
MKKTSRTILTPSELQTRRTLRQYIRTACKHYMRAWPNRHRSLEAVLIEMLAEATASSEFDLIDALANIRRDKRGWWQ